MNNLKQFINENGKGLFVIIILFTLFAAIIKTPFVIPESQRTTFFERNGFFTIVFYYLLISFFYFLFVYIVTRTEVGKRITTYIKYSFDRDTKQESQVDEIIDELHTSTKHTLKHERDLKDLEIAEKQELINKISGESNMQRVINIMIEKLPLEDAKFVINAFIGKDKPFETKADYNEHVRQQHEKEMMNLEKQSKEKTIRREEAQTKFEEFRTDQKIDEQKDE